MDFTSFQWNILLAVSTRQNGVCPARTGKLFFELSSGSVELVRSISQ